MKNLRAVALACSIAVAAPACTRDATSQHEPASVSPAHPAPTEGAAPLPTTSAAPCALPDQPRALVLRVTHSYVPMDVTPPHEERGEIAAEGGCVGQTFCRTVSREVLLAVLARVRPALAVHHAAASGSPHYGGRYVELRFAGGQCTIGDDSLGAVTAADMPLFDAAFDAIVSAYAPSDAGRPQP